LLVGDCGGGGECEFEFNDDDDNDEMSLSRCRYQLEITFHLLDNHLPFTVARKTDLLVKRLVQSFPVKEIEDHNINRNSASELRMD